MGDRKIVSIRIERPSLSKYVNEYCVCKGRMEKKHIRKHRNRVCISKIHINELRFDHIWISDSILSFYPLYATVYFTGIITPYRKANFTKLSYTVVGVHIISRIEYDKKIRPFIIKDTTKTLKHLKHW
jgi:hypothetical protein